MVDGASLNAARASPKSQIFSLQSELASIFFGFKSRWKTFAAKRKKESISTIEYVKPREILWWYNKRVSNLYVYTSELEEADTRKIGNARD